jgi:hypothetical protein
VCTAAASRASAALGPRPGQCERLQLEPPSAACTCHTHPPSASAALAPHPNHTHPTTTTTTNNNNDNSTTTTKQVQSWSYTGKTRTVRAAARAARDAGVRVRELCAAELTPEMRQRLLHDVSSDWLQQKAVADRELRVFVRHVDYDAIELRDGVRIFVAEAYADAACAPPARVDAALQGAGALNAKPPKPPKCVRAHAWGRGGRGALAAVLA